MKVELEQIHALSLQYWEKFESTITQTFFRGVLALVPKMIWDNGKMYASKDKVTPKPEGFVLGIIELWKEFAKQLVYRLR
jgi:hypothetical protein